MKYAIIAAMLLASTGAIAAEEPKITYSFPPDAKLMAPDGKAPLNYCTERCNSTDPKDPPVLKDWTLRDLAVTALRQPPKQGQARSIDDAVALGELIQRIAKASGPLDLTLDELKLIKDSMGQINDPLLVTDAIQIIDPKSVKK